MDKERMLQLADVIEKHDLDMDFNMNIEYIKRDCGTVGCILGWAAALYTGSPHKNANIHNFVEIMDISIDNAQALCYFSDLEDREDLCWGSVTSHQAAQVIRTFVEKGYIDWKEVLDDDNYIKWRN